MKPGREPLGSFGYQARDCLSAKDFGHQGPPHIVTSAIAHERSLLNLRLMLDVLPKKKLIFHNRSLMRFAIS
jgi:hypothetical protein